MKKHITKIGAIVLATTLALGTLFLVPKAGKVRAEDTDPRWAGNVIHIDDSNTNNGVIGGDTPVTNDINKGGNAESVTTWVLDRDVTFANNKRAKVQAGTFILDLHGHKWTSGAQLLGLTLNTNTSCLIIDSAPTDESGFFVISNYSAIAFEGRANLTIDGARISGGGASITLKDNSTVVIKNQSVIENCSARAIVTGKGCTVSIENSYIRNNAGALKVTGNNTTATITDNSEICNNTLSDDGSAGIYIGSGASVSISSSKIYGNSATSGAGVYISDSSSSCTITNSSIYDNTATSYGGAIYTKGTLTINGGEFTGNAVNTDGSGGEGGAIYISSGTTCLSNCTITQNVARSGSGIQYDNGTLRVSGNVMISGNTYIASGVSGENLRLASGKKITIDGDLENSQIGVIQSPCGVFTTGLSGHGSISNFTCDYTANYSIVGSNGEASISESNLLGGCQVAVGGAINVRYCLNVPSEDRISDTTVTFTVNGRTTTEALSNSHVSDGLFYFDVSLQPTEMTAPISVLVHLAGTNNDHVLKSLTVAQIVKSYENDPASNWSTKDIRIAKAMLDYGARAQQYWGVNTSELPVEPTTFNLDNEILTHVHPGTTTTDQNIYFYGASLQTLNKTNMRLYFWINSSIQDQYSINVDGTTLTKALAKDTTSFYYVWKNDIAPTEYGNDVSISITKPGESTPVITMTYSPLNYMARVINNSEDDNLKNLVRSMYNFYKVCTSQDGTY